MLNQIQVIGRLGGDPEMRFTPNGNPVCSLRVASSRKFQVNGEQREETDWFTVVTWNKTAEHCNQYLVKGQLVYVQGRVHLKTWEKQDGGTASQLEVTAQNVIFLSKPNNGNGNSGPAEPAESGDVTPDDIPFY